ncbi:L,D-transpeptidase family protein [Sinanaerobacter chloroacetimidivorans]|jgi:murein L,D-transpeptidase YafK|uniref:L,D-transpeptidase n=1 Tax=Sinanaerobacter chloroacetimidivorans TaxID=2818044 RepID=A0A8J7W0Z1_9FIRM|nr:L,D-transpeptidase [Sinanaerobacter chloroacetimidivorans]MBR0597213.1 L,D-transpeptidase [Sinanaerobacter chloroacetimidivorans]
MSEIRVYKKDRRLEFWQDGELIQTFKISLGFSPDGEKLRNGDGRTPEGSYYICTKNPVSKFTLFLGISYPNIADAERGFREGLISQEEYDFIKVSIEQGKRPCWETALGGKIGIHGMGTSRDWTAGCVAMEDEDIKWLWDHTELGNPVHIYK